MREQGLTRLVIGREDVEHVTVVVTLGRSYEQAEMPGAFEVQKAGAIAIADVASSLCDELQVLELGQQERTHELGRHVRRTKPYPSILGDLTAAKRGAVRALVADDLGLGNQRWVVDAKRTALTADVVLRFVKRVTAELADGTQRSPFVSSVNALGSIFDGEQVVRASDLHNRVHLARYSGVVDGKDGFGARGDGLFDLAFVDVERVFADVDEHRFGAGARDGVGRRHEGKRR